MVKSRVLIIKTGGTIAQKLGANRALFPSEEEYLHLVPGLEDIADFDVVSLGSIDSTNMETNIGFLRPPTEYERTRDRAAVARTIYAHPQYDGYVVIHGTDTMAETAAALTYMLQGLRKPIVLTGAQLPITNLRTDGKNNVFTAVQAATMDIGEVVIAFGSSVLRGTRARKTSEQSFEAFSSPNVEAIGRVTPLSQGIILNQQRIKADRKNSHPVLFTDFDTRVFHYLHVSGAMVDKDLEYIMQSPHNKAILLGSFGAGNIPDRITPYIAMAREKGKPVIVYTRCAEGAADMGIYSVGAAPLTAGATSAGDMTFEALGQKLMYALGMAETEGIYRDKLGGFVDSVITTAYNGDITVTEIRK